MRRYVMLNAHIAGHLILGIAGNVSMVFEDDRFKSLTVSHNQPKDVGLIQFHNRGENENGRESASLGS